MVMTAANHEPIPADFPVQPLKPGQKAKDKVTCGHCGLSWDDAIPTTYTPAPSARCPFEAFHIHHEPTVSHTTGKNTRIVFVCTNIEKFITEDSFLDGELDGDETIFDRTCDIEADTLEELVEKLREEIGVDVIDNLSPIRRGANPNFNSPYIKTISFERNETQDGKLPTASQTKKWRAGKAKQYTARYLFDIKKRLKLPFVTDDELETLKIYQSS